MTREQQKKFKEIRTALPKILQSVSKEYGFKKKDYIVWSKKQEMIFTLFVFERVLDGRCYIDITIQFKPFWVDNLLWDILQMPENKNQPVSLRCIGAFSVNGCVLYKETIELVDWSIDELTDCTDSAMKKFAVIIDETQSEDFKVQADTNPYHSDIREVLMLVHNREYDVAIEYAKNMPDDCFVNKGLGFRTAVIQYCEKQKNI